MRLLIIEDNLNFQKFLKERLEEKCFAVDTASTGRGGLALARTNIYDLVILDYTLPEMNGYELCSELRLAGKETPIIIISGMAATPHKLQGFDLGIDDYLVKPFFFEELLARANAILRRPHTLQHTVLKFEDLTLDTKAQSATRGKRPLRLTRKEFSLLEHLMKNARNVVSRGEIMDHVWDSSMDIFSNTIETHIMNLRRKVDYGNHRRLIHSVSGRGYKIDTLK